MALNSKSYTNDEKYVFAGDYPVATTQAICNEKIEEGEIVGYDNNFEFGKYGDVYTNIYGIAFKNSGKKTGDDTKEYCEVLLTGEFHSSFVVIPKGKESEIKTKLRNISIFIK
ncbi:MAG: hypothetical protein ACRC51_04110 [Cetobacterium sp.]